MDRAVSGLPSDLRAASRAVLFAHTAKTLFALALLGGFGRDLAGVASAGDWVEIARFVMQDGRRYAAAAQWAVCAYVLVGPLLTQYVLAALARRERPLRSAVRRYRAALGLAVLRIAALGSAGALAVSLAQALAARVPPELEVVARAVPVALGCALLAWLATAHDVAAAQLATDEPPSAKRALAAGAHASAGLVAIHVAFILAIALTYGAGEAASRYAWPALGFALAQACALGAAFVNAAWLRSALARTSRPFRAGTY